ncbi:IS3 family transposase [Flavobacterium sp. N1736]|uniref:IS3 family transposase n=1 Tax=Flavobacterium sp. N1736 TaxID=2986823 RepID=UPI0022242BEB|nr:IS3 family transposase [Flavobacterium sp. N1736]
MKENKKNYDSTFKEKVVKLSYESGTINELEKEFHLYDRSIAIWQKNYEKLGTVSFPGKSHQRFSPEQERIYWLEKKIKDLDLKFEILKNGRWNISQGKPMVFDFIKSNEKTYPIRLMCKVFGISYITYCRWRSECISEAKKRRILVKEEIRSIFFDSKQRYGSVRITIELQNRGYKISRSSVLLYMRELNLYSKFTKTAYK